MSPTLKEVIVVAGLVVLLTSWAALAIYGAVHLMEELGWVCI